MEGDDPDIYTCGLQITSWSQFSYEDAISEGSMSFRNCFESRSLWPPTNRYDSDSLSSYKQIAKTVLVYDTEGN